MSQYIYRITRRDFLHHEDTRSYDTFVGQYDALQDANEAAEAHAEDETNGCDLEPTTNKWGGVDYYCFCAAEQDHREIFEVTIGRVPVQKHSVAKAKPATSREPVETTYGSVVGIPLGKPCALKGATFFLDGHLKTMNRETFELAVQLYGGKLSDVYKDIQYAVMGSDVSDEYIGTFGAAQVLNELGFFSLIQNGLPCEGHTPNDGKMPVRTNNEPPAKRQKI